MYKRINGIQHIGVGVSDSEESQKWYRKFFGMDIRIFDGVAPAPLMDVYTHQKTITKRASMILSLKGGCAMEVVNPTSFTPKKPDFETQLGDIGIYINQIKSPDVAVSYEFFVKNGAKLLSEVVKMPNGDSTFYCEDPNGLIFQVLPGKNFYMNTKHNTGGPSGCVIGVTSIESSLKLYSEILGYDEVVYDETGVFEDFANLTGGDKTFRRIRLTQSNPPGGGFAKVSADTYIELVQAHDYDPKKVYKGRIWGDIGFVHVGLDVRGMKALGEELEEKGFGFTCDTKDTLDMGGTTRVHCTYIDDPDGILIEMIEVYKIPIIEKLGVFLNVEKRDPLKPLPDFMLKALRFGRIKD
ncbi:MAG: VOC family protein [Cyclobacteriaceae bacterium]